MLAARNTLPRAEIAGDWYERIYLPTVEAIRREELDRACPQATDPDRFLWVYQRRRELVPERGCVPIEEAARQANGAGRSDAAGRLRRLLWTA